MLVVRLLTAPTTAVTILIRDDLLEISFFVSLWVTVGNFSLSNGTIAATTLVVSWPRREDISPLNTRVNCEDEKVRLPAWMVVFGTVHMCFVRAFTRAGLRSSFIRSVAILMKLLVDISLGNMSGQNTPSTYSSAVMVSTTLPSAVSPVSLLRLSTTPISNRSCRNWGTTMLAALAVASSLEELPPLRCSRNFSIWLAVALADAGRELNSTHTLLRSSAIVIHIIFVRSCSS